MCVATKRQNMMQQFLSKTNLFRGIAPSEVPVALKCLGAYERRFKKGTVIYKAGDVVHEIGLVLEGSVNIVANFFWGNSAIFGHIARGKIFGESNAALPNKELSCDIVAAENCNILFLNLNRVLAEVHCGCKFHSRIIQNIVRISAAKNLNLSSRMMHIAPKAIRDKLLAYLSEQALECGSNDFVIPFSRQQLADYLGVDRSALSNELSKMQRDGLLLFEKNHFVLKEI